MKILILGGDGYLGWPTAMHLAAAGHTITVADNYLRRHIAEETNSGALMSLLNLTERANIFKQLTGHEILAKIGDLSQSEFMFTLVSDVMPDAIIHYAEQPSAPYSMAGFKEAQVTFQNNLAVTFNCIWAVKELAPHCHIIKLGTMGEYGTPNIDIEEGWINIEHKGRSQKFLYPRAAGSLYHTTKVLDTDLLWFYVRNNKLKVTDLMQGPVYGLTTDQSIIDDRLLPHFHYDDIFGTVINRFLVQAVSGVPLTVYGGGGQTRGYINLIDTLQCVQLAVENPPPKGELKIFNQFTETFSVNQLAKLIVQASHKIKLNVKIKHIPNPRLELEEHYYNPHSTELKNLGLQPTLLSDAVLIEMLTKIQKYTANIDKEKIMPRVTWSQ